MKCPNCGADRINEFNICEYCGSRLGQLNREKSKEIKETKRIEIEKSIDEKARSKMKSHLIFHIIFLFLFMIVGIIPVIGIVVCSRGFSHIKNNRKADYEKTLKISTVLLVLCVVLGLAINIFTLSSS